MTTHRALWRAAVGLLACLVLAACSEPGDAGGGPATEDAGDRAPQPAEAAPVTEETADEPPEAQAQSAAAPRPAWLGTRVLPTRPDGFGEIQPTPPELDDRRLVTPAQLPPPPGNDFVAAVVPVPDEVVARSTWSPECPVGLEDLRYVTVSFWGFDEQHHTGELLVHASAAQDIVTVFERLHEARFPIEELRVTAPHELELEPTGDGNVSAGFVCRASVGSGSWSQHAYGLAVDINPFHNPYLKGDVVVPELASSYLERERHRPGMIQPGDVVTAAFADIGWKWGGNWRSAKDWMHFSRTGG